MLQLPECLTLQMEHFGFHDFRFLISDSNHSANAQNLEKYHMTHNRRLRTVTRNQ